MKQATVKLPSGEYVLAEIAGWDKYHNPIYDNILFPGSWQLLGADPTRLTEVEAGEIVDSLIVEVEVPVRAAGYGRYTMFKNYTTDDQFNFACPVATLSLDSLAASLGIEKPFVVLKNKTDNNDK